MAIRQLPRRWPLHLAARLRCDWSGECTGRSDKNDDQLGKMPMFAVERPVLIPRPPQVVILFELTGAIDLVLQIMMAGELVLVFLCKPLLTYPPQSWSPSLPATSSPRTVSTRVSSAVCLELAPS